MDNDQHGVMKAQMVQPKTWADDLHDQQAAIARAADESRRRQQEAQDRQSLIDAIADAWASIDGKMDGYHAPDDAKGYRAGYQTEAAELLIRAEKRLRRRIVMGGNL